MTRDEILVVADTNKIGCEALNKAVHEKLGLCWHRWEQDPPYPYEVDSSTKWMCSKCRYTKSVRFIKGDHPDYTHDIKAAWAIKEWLDKQSRTFSYENALFDLFGDGIGAISLLIWATPFYRCKAFLLMDSDV